MYNRWWFGDNCGEKWESLWMGNWLERVRLYDDGFGWNGGGDVGEIGI